MTNPIVASRSNADWCAAVCRAHGIATASTNDAWASPTRTPRYYPDAVTLRPDVSASQVLAVIDTSPGASVKDSFADLDLAPHGFDILFTATWIGRAATPATLRDGFDWSEVDTVADLEQWEAAWRDDPGIPTIFPPALLDDPTVIILSAEHDDVLTGGVILSTGHGVIGLSNLFAADGDGDEIWAGALAWAGRTFPTVPTVGYESGGDLQIALRHGFAPLGPLRVWIKHA